MKYKIYLDDVRTPIDKDWVVVRNYEEFVDKINEIGLENIELISLDHDLGDSAMSEWLYRTTKNYQINYDNITEKTGYDCAKWFGEYCWDNGLPVPKWNVHSANPVGKENIENYLKKHGLENVIVLYGNVDKETIKKAYQQAHFLLFISKSEGWPKVVAEAMFWACLPITSNVSCIPFMLDNGKRGAIVNSDIKEISGVIEEYLKEE